MAVNQRNGLCYILIQTILEVKKMYR